MRFITEEHSNLHRFGKGSSWHPLWIKTATRCSPKVEPRIYGHADCGEAEAATFDVQAMSAIVEKASGDERVLYALPAGSGLRIGEALALEIKHISPDHRTVRVEQSCWRRRLQEPKTRNAYRQVDLCSPLADWLNCLSEIANRTKSGRQTAVQRSSPKPFAPPNSARIEGGEKCRNETKLPGASIIGPDASICHSDNRSGG